MALKVVATPIGNIQDITLRAIEALKGCEMLIGEERKVASRLISQLELGRKEIELLNEHSTKEDLEYLVTCCRERSVALISDCGTPGFCDPGQNLVKECRRHGIPVEILPGASSLMVFLSGCGERMDQFYFQGFLPAKKELRNQCLQNLSGIKIPVILMDTPYRLNRTLEDILQFFPKSKVLLGHSLTNENERFYRDTPKNLLKKLQGKKLEFVLAILP